MWLKLRWIAEFASDYCILVLPISYYSLHSSRRSLSFRLSLRCSIHHCGQRLNDWEVSTGEKHNQMTAKAKTAVTSCAGDEVVCFGEEKKQPEKSPKPQTWNCSPQTNSQAVVVRTASCRFLSCYFFIDDHAQYSVRSIQSTVKAVF